MIIDDNGILSFKLNQTNNISNYYFKKYKYEEIKMKLNLNNDKYKNIKEIFNLFDSSIKQNYLKLINKNNNINLLIIIINNNNQIQHYIPLDEKYQYKII